MKKEMDCIYAVATADTKGRELFYVRDLIARTGVKVATVDLSTRHSATPSLTDFSAEDVAACHPLGAEKIFAGDRSEAIPAMAEAFDLFLRQRRDVAGVIGLGGSCGTALIAPALRSLPIGIPKLIVSTMASGEISGYVGASDITMLYSVTDIAGLNRISRRVLGNAAHQIAGAVSFALPTVEAEKPALGLTMFGVTTPCIEAVGEALGLEYDCLVFHATGSGGRAMEKLADSGMLVGLLDVTTSEVCDLLFGGVLACGEDRFDALARSRLPAVISCGALDMINFGSPETVPEKYAGRTFYHHNPQVTLMRTTAEENVVMARWIAKKLNRCEGQMRFLIPEGGFSALDSPGQPFWSAAADRAFITTLEAELIQTARRKIVHLPWNINDARFANALVEQFRQLINRER